jgi:MFS family permease
MDNVRKLYLFKFFQSMHLFGGVLIPFFTSWGKISYLQITLLQAWFVLWVTLLEVPTGAVADRFGRKTSIFLGALTIIAAAVIYSSSPSFPIFLIGEFLWALSTALISGADQALLYDSLKIAGREKESKNILGRYHAIGLWGIAIGAPIGSWIGATFGLQYSVRAMAIPFFAASMIALTLQEYRHHKQEEENYLTTLLHGTNYFLRHPVLRILAMDALIISALSFFIVWTYQPVILELGLPLAFLGIIHGVCVLFEIMVSGSFEKLEKFSGSKLRYTFISALLIAAGLIVLSLSRSLILAILASIIVFAFGFTRGVLFSNYMNKHIESKNRATVLSAISMFGTLARTILYPFIGLMMEYSVNMTLLLLGVMVIVVSSVSRVEEHMLLD